MFFINDYMNYVKLYSNMITDTERAYMAIVIYATMASTTTKFYIKQTKMHYSHYNLSGQQHKLNSSAAGIYAKFKS